MADNTNKVTIDAEYFAELYHKANNPIDEMERNYNDVIVAKDREIAAVKDERNRLNAKVGELMKQKEAAEKCINEVWSATAHAHNYQENCVEARRIIRAYREKKVDNQ